MLALRLARVMILLGPLEPKFIALALVASENVGEGGPGEKARLLEPKVNVRRDRGRAGAIMGEKMVVVVSGECAQVNIPYFEMRCRHY